MMSVRNLLLPLNGNKIIMGLVLVFLILNTSSCGATRQPGSQKPQSSQKPDKNISKPDTGKVVIKPKDRLKDSLDQLYPVIRKDKYKIAVFLPLYLDLEDREKEQRTAVSVSQDFYKGIKVAADTLRKCGYKLEIQVIDSEFPLFNRYTLQDTLKRMNPDLIIGPVLDSRLYYMDSIANALKINRVSPISTADMCRPGNYLFESFPSPTQTGIAASRMIAENYPDHKVILVNEKTTADNPIAAAFAGQFKPYGISVVNFSGKGASTYAPEFFLDKKNILFIPSKSEVFVSALMAQLRLKASDSTQIKVVGIVPWTFFNSIEGEVWEKLNVHLVYPYEIDYTSASTQRFLASFRQKYKDEPSLWSIIGFDEMLYYAKLLHEHGKYFQRAIVAEHTESFLTPDKAGPGNSLTDWNSIHTRYKLQFDTTCPGWRNTYLNFLEFDNFELKRLNSSR